MPPAILGQITLHEMFRSSKKAQDITMNSDRIEQPAAYAENVVNAALVLNRAGLGPFTYHTQYSSGTTLWQYHDASVSVTADGIIGG